MFDPTAAAASQLSHTDLGGHGGCWRPKTPLGGQKWHEGVEKSM